MFDTMTLTKIVGSLCGALLIFMMGNWAAEELYNTSPGHGGDDHAQGYVIDTGSDDDAGAGADEGPSLAELWAAADIDKGAKVFGKCKACHKLEDGANATGPYLYGVVGRDVSSAAGFGYSGALKPVVDVWTPETLDAFLENPKGYTPGTSMGFSGLKKAEDRVNVIAYLDQLDGDMFEMAAPAAAEEEAAVEEAGSEESAAAAVTAEEPAEAEVEATPEAEAAAEEATTEEEAAVEEEPAVEEEAAPEDAAPEEAAEEAATEESAAEETATEETATEEAAAEEPAAEASGFAALVAAADVAKGEKLFKRCKACHVLEAGTNRVGPYLSGIVGRDIASVEGFNYSETLEGLDGDWTVDALNGFLEKPQNFAPGTNMGFPGLRKEEDRAAIILYLQNATE